MSEYEQLKEIVYWVRMSVGVMDSGEDPSDVLFDLLLELDEWFAEL